MFNRRQIVFLVAVAFLLAAPGAGAEENEFTAASTPALTRPSTPTVYTVTITNSPTSNKSADRAKIGIPEGFAVEAETVAATTSTTEVDEECVVTTWVADGTLIANGKINLKRPDGNPHGNELCPGAHLTVSFAASAQVPDGVYTWVTELLRQDTAFTPPGTHPTIRVDGTPPSVALAQRPADPNVNRRGAFAFASDEPASFECRLDGGAFLPCTSPASYDGLADGAHAFSVRAVDAAGNAGSPASYAWRIDATAPETRLGARPRARTRNTSATFTFAATEAAAFLCRLDGASFVPCTSPKTYGRLRRAVHNFEVRAVDQAGNVDATPAGHRWTVVAAVRRAKAAGALLAPQAGERITSPPLLRWRRVARASYYNVQLYRGSAKVLSTWPTRPRLQIRARWTYRGRQRRLVPGSYRWFVWPHFGSEATGRYGRLLGKSTFTVIGPSGR